jgi:sirohydrochlorin cobaltochelatase
VVSFGTSFNDNRAATIGAVEAALERAFPDYDVRRAFTADTIIEHIYRRDGQLIDNVKEALERAKRNGVEELVVQPTHLMNGWEYGDLVKALEKYEGDFASIKIGAPLLTTDDDFSRVADAMAAATKELAQDGKTAVCWMGHGTAAASHAVYEKMQKVLADKGCDNHFVGTVEASPTAGELAKQVKEAGYTRVILRPMMIVAGDHANNDMADEKDPESWYSVFTAAGLEVQCELKGLGELKEIQDLLAAHARDAKPLGDTGIGVEPNPDNPDGKTALADGVYAIQVECEQSMFKIDRCTLTVKDGAMTAQLVLGSDSFDKMFAGTAAAAKLAKDGVVDGLSADGETTFTLPVAELDKPLDYAAHSVRKDAWYDRTLTFLADTAKAE